MTTYYDYSAAHLGSTSSPSGIYSRSGQDITVGAAEAFASGGGASVILFVSGTGEAIALWEADSGLWAKGELFLVRSNTPFIFSTVSGGLSGVTGIGSESLVTAGLYRVTPIGDQTFSPVKVNFSFAPGFFTFNGASGNGVSTSFTATPTDVPPEKPTNPTPTDTDTGIVLLPTLSWQAG